MVKKFKYCSEKIFSYQQNSDQSFDKQVRAYIHFTSATFRVDKKIKIPDQTIITKPEALKKLLDKTIEIEFNCVSDEAIKGSFLEIAASIETETSKLDNNYQLSPTDIIDELKIQKEKFRILKKEYDINSRLFFNSSITILVSNGIDSIQIPRHEYEQIDDPSLRGYLIANMEIRKELVEEIISRIESEINIATSNLNTIRPLVAKNDTVASRYIFEYVEILSSKKIISNDKQKNHLIDVLAGLLNIDKRKLARDKNDYKDAKSRFHLFEKIMREKV